MWDGALCSCVCSPSYIMMCWCCTWWGAILFYAEILLHYAGCAFDYIVLCHGWQRKGIWSKTKIHHSVLELGALNLFKYVTLGNLWIYVLYESNELYTRAVDGTFLLYLFYKWLMFAALTIALAYGLSRAKLFHDQMVKYYTTFLHAAGCCIALAVTLSMPALDPGAEQHTAAEIVGCWF